MKCNCYWCVSFAAHPERHKQFQVVSSRGDQAMVACQTCGHTEPYDPIKHVDVVDLDC